MVEFSREKEMVFCIPAEKEKGIVRIAEKVAKDVETVAGCCPLVTGERGLYEQGILALSADKGEVSLWLEKQFTALAKVRGKREVYGFFLADRPVLGIENCLVIYGSDRLGTIYGLFHLSEILGVSPCHYWGDVKAPSYEKVFLCSTEDEEKLQNKEKQLCLSVPEQPRISKEPSVKYRGFFINDEWPCFGNWTFSHFGGFTAEMYDKVFEYLLRMKGNYLWPAMWTSSFLVDGPGMQSMELADSYGIYIGMSHHEPCMRSSEEWDMVKGEKYGRDWSYLSNREGLLEYWKDGLLRSRGHHVFPTIGMRGERDSKMMGEASVADNIRVLKDILTDQRTLIREYLQEEEEIPQLFAVYKEVEDYYFGDNQAEGLEHFEELEGVTLLLCEDNFGNMRALPKEEERSRKGGFGMYYHLDYHGGPVSYEWVASVPLTKIWEQMTEAYAYGVRELWIVNVGDLKFQEYPLNYFMEMAYDFDTWGSAHPESPKAYTEKWVQQQFGPETSPEERNSIKNVVEEYIRLNHLRRPESCSSEVYHPVHYREGSRMRKRCEELEETNERLREALKGRRCEEAYYSMVYYPAAASANLLQMHLYAGFNHLYARQGKAIANLMGEKMEQCIERDEALAQEMAAFAEGKWAGMEMALHIGFTNWNSEDWRYPVRHVLRLPQTPRLVVSRWDEEAHFTNQYFPTPLVIEDFLEENSKEVGLEIANGGQGEICWEIKETCDWLLFSEKEGKTALQDCVLLTVDREKLSGEEKTCTFYVVAGEEKVPVCVRAKREELPALPGHTAISRKGIFAIDAVNYAEKKAGDYKGEAAEYGLLTDFGKYGSGMKVFPVTAAFDGDLHAPSLTYELWSRSAGKGRLRLFTSPANPLMYGGELRVGISCNAGEIQKLVLTDSRYKGGDNDCAAWERAVLNQEHVAEMEISLQEGLNRITVYAGEAGIVLERLVVLEGDAEMEDSYLGIEK